MAKNVFLFFLMLNCNVFQPEDVCYYSLRKFDSSLLDLFRHIPGIYSTFIQYAFIE